MCSKHTCSVAGGVGLAAIQVVQKLGAQLYATAGSPAKRSLLRSLGAQHVVNSRSPELASDLAQAGGVDVVLNSLTSPGMVAGSMAGVRPVGRFVEISKRDIWSPARLAQDRPDLHYSLLAVDFLPPSAVHSALTRAAQAVSSGSFCPLPQVTHGLQNVQAALRQMTQARHVGKVVVTCASSQQPVSQAHGRWVVTGGLGSLGALVSSWLSQHGAEDLMLTGRTGKLLADHKDLVQLLRSTRHNALVTIVRSDLASQEEAQLHSQSTASGSVVSGVVHASGALADATLQKQSLAGIRTVFAAKLTSIHKLQSATRAQPIMHQLLFSSVAALLGSPGQANYSAANGALDGLAAHLGAQGQTGVCSIQWGGWAGGGMAGGDASTAARLARMGMPLIAPSQGLAALSAVLTSQSPPSVMAAVPFDWGKFLQQGLNSKQAVFSELVTESLVQLPARTQPAADALSTRLVNHESRVSPAQQAEAIAAAVHSTVSSVLGCSVSSSAPLMAAGLDSLGMVELRNALQTKLGLQMPSTLVFDYPTADDIIAYVTAQLSAAAAASSQLEAAHFEATQPPTVQPMKAQQQQHASSLVTDAQATDMTLVVQEVVASILGAAPAADTPLMAAGLDSLGMVEVRNALQSRLGLQLPSTLLFDYPSVEAISGFVSQNLASIAPAQQVTSPAVLAPALRVNIAQQQQQAASQNLVVTAMVTSAPQGAFNNTVPMDTVTPVPLSRWFVDSPPEGLFTGPAVRFGSYLRNPDAFDVAAFSTSDTEAVYMDPQQRMLLQSAAEALASSQLLGGSFPPNVGQKAGASVGVFVGVSSSDYEKLVMKHTRGVTAYTATGRAVSVISGRLSYTFALRGPSLTVDTACSSSLVSLHMASNSLMLGQCSAACNNGVNVMISPETPAAFQKAGMLSADGRCKTLDSSADGYVRAEVCGSMVVQHANAVEPSAVVAVFRGSAVNQDGRSSSLTAPNGPSQQGVIRQALQASALEPHQIQALQLHGTGTHKNDAALCASFLYCHNHMQMDCVCQRALNSFCNPGFKHYKLVRSIVHCSEQAQPSLLTVRSTCFRLSTHI